ncbi:unnamed protein product [Brassica oleracea]|uniref:(rape) hypothetical protein n=1 Tax=Brassica napus TaxID=3708 RepID=A0A816IDV8_BRANA|nr:unnamed protein product [Brassica napus]
MTACIANRLFVLSDKLASELYVNWTYVINVDCLSLDSRELTAIVHRSSHLSATVVDVLIHHTRSLFLSYSEQSHSRSSVFMDTKFVALLAKTFPKFSMSSKK